MNKGDTKLISNVEHKSRSHKNHLTELKKQKL